MNVLREIGFAKDASVDNNGDTVTVFPGELGLTVHQTIDLIVKDCETRGLPYCLGRKPGQDPVINGSDEDGDNKWSLCIAPRNAFRASDYANHIGCCDCGDPNARTGHMECMYPGRASDPR